MLFRKKKKTKSAEKTELIIAYEHWKEKCKQNKEK